MSKESYSYVDYYLGIGAVIFLIIYVILVSTNRYINKNSPEWILSSIDDKKYVGYTNMCGNIFMILVCGFDSVIYTNKNIYTSRYIIKLVVLLIFIGLAYDVAIDNSAYGKFNAALQPLVGYLQVLSIGTIVQIIRRLDIKLNKSTSSDSDESIERSNSIGSIFEKYE
jgi:hypothetical protein